jgi:hypothetical protein
MKPGKLKIILLVIMYVITLIINFGFVMYIKLTVEDKNIQFKISNDMVTVFYDHNFEVQLFYARLLRGIAFNKGYLPLNT